MCNCKFVYMRAQRGRKHWELGGFPYNASRVGTTMLAPNKNNLSRGSRLVYGAATSHC